MTAALVLRTPQTVLDADWRSSPAVAGVAVAWLSWIQQAVARLQFDANLAPLFAVYVPILCSALKKSYNPVYLISPAKS